MRKRKILRVKNLDNDCSLGLDDLMTKISRKKNNNEWVSEEDLF